MVTRLHQPLFPSSVRRWVGVSVAVLVLAALVGLAWRGPALLLDLAAMGSALWCF